MSAPRGLDMRGLMARLALLAGAVAVAAALAASLGAAPRHAQPAAPTLYPDHFPEGPGDDIAARACVVCHSAMLVTQQAKDSLGWEKTLALMEKWGAPVALSERDSLRVYLLTHFGPRPKQP